MKFLLYGFELVGLDLVSLFKYSLFLGVLIWCLFGCFRIELLFTWRLDFDFFRHCKSTRTGIESTGK
jgi:hypothetical protein